MGIKISVCGKGGSGKSTLVGLLAGQAEGRRLSVLVVDSDESNSGLFRTLGFEKPPAPLMDLVGGKKKLKGKMTRTNILNAGQILIRDIPGEHIIKQNGLEGRPFAPGKAFRAAGKVLDFVVENIGE